MRDRDDDESLKIEGEPSKKVKVHTMWQGESRGIVAEYENEDDLLQRHLPNHGRQEAVLVRKVGQKPRYVPIKEYIDELKARKQQRP